jgi:hypothetical protein
MKRVIITLAMLLIPAALFAQREAIPALAVISGPGFLTALIAGIILAFGFQLILMNLSAALGLSALHSGMKKAEEKVGSVHLGEKTGVGSVKVGERQEESSEPMESTVRKLNAGFGVWAIVTASISLFFAAWFAVKLGTAFNVLSGVVLGLAIWGLFYLITSALEMAAMSSMIGSLMGVMRSGFRTVSQAASDIFQPSAEKKAADTARQITDAVRQEIFGDVNMRKTIQDYISQLRPDYQKIRNELTAILNNAQIDIRAMPDQHSATAWVHTGTAAPGAAEMKGAAQAAAGTAKEAVEKIREEARSDKDTAEKIADTMMELAGMSRQEAESYRHKVEDYLARTGKPELNPEGIKRDIDKLVSENPKAGIDGILARLNDIDKSTITTILAQRKDMNRDEANRVVNMVSGTVSSLKSQYEKTKEAAAGPSRETRGSIEARMRSYLDSLDNPELHYDNIVSDFQTLLHDPRAGAESLIHVLETVDRKDLKQMITHSGMNISEEDIDRTIGRIEDARDTLMHRAEQVREEVETRVQMAEQEALRRTDEVRKVAASAAWWVFSAALISGIAAAVGGLVGIMF